MFDIALETSATVNPAYTPSKFSWLLNLHVRCSGDAAIFKSDTSRLKHRMEQNFEKMAQKRPNQTTEGNRFIQKFLSHLLWSLRM